MFVDGTDGAEVRVLSHTHTLVPSVASQGGCVLPLREVRGVKNGILTIGQITVCKSLYSCVNQGKNVTTLKLKKKTYFSKKKLQKLD